MPEDDAAYPQPGSTKRPARIVGRPRRRLPALAPPAPEPVPGLNVSAAELVDTWIERITKWSHDGDVIGFEFHVSVFAGMLTTISQALQAAGDRRDAAGPVLRELAGRPEPLARAVLLAFVRLGTDDGLSDRAGHAVDAAATRQGVAGRTAARPAWFADFEQEPVGLAECGELDILGDPDRLLLLSFTRSGVFHGFAVCVNDAECGEANQIMLLDDDLPFARGLSEVAGELLVSGTRFAYCPLDAAEARRRIEIALARRADHDADADPQDLIDEFNAFERGDEDPLTYLTLLPLLRHRLGLLPAPEGPLPPHRESRFTEPVVQMIELLRRDGGPLHTTHDLPLSALPAKRREKDGPAPVLRLRIDLKYMKPPVWRRLEVPADLSLADLHDAIQIAFEWDDEHVHVFLTDYGAFGNGEARFLEEHDAAAATVEQLLRTVGDKIEYVYDLGGEWRHVIELERKLPPEPGIVPRCTGGRRAAPEEDAEDPWAYLNGAPDVLDRPGIDSLLGARFAGH